MRHELYTDAYRRRGMGVVFLLIAMTVLALLFAACDEWNYHDKYTKPFVIVGNRFGPCVHGHCFTIYKYQDKYGKIGEFQDERMFNVGDTIK